MRWRMFVSVAMCAIISSAAMLGQYAAAQDADNEEEHPPWVHTFTPERVIYVSPDGGGDGTTEQSPISLEQAIDGGEAGDKFICLPGAYEGEFNLRGRGTKEQPIVFRAKPGERVTIKGKIQMGGSYNWLWGFEITDPDYRSSPVEARGPGVHIINNIIHNAGGGIGGWNTGPDHVYYGNIICHVGGDVETREERRTNYPIYTQHDYFEHGDYKYIVQNMLLDSRPHRYPTSANFHAYGEGGPALSGFYVTGNIMANGLFLIGGFDAPHRYNVVDANYFFNSQRVQFGYRRPNQFKFRDNYLGRSHLFIPYLWGADCQGRQGVLKPQPSVITGNKIINPHGRSGEHVDITSFSYQPDKAKWRGGGTLDPEDVFDENVYSANFRGRLHSAGNQGVYNSLEEWRDASEAAGNRFDENSVEIPAPEEPFVATTVNEYEKGRGHLVIFNWGNTDVVEADLSDIVEEGARFTVHRARRAFDAPVAEGVYEGPVGIPMQDIEFDAFLVRVAQED